MLTEAGFAQAASRPLTLGIVYLYSAPAARSGTPASRSPPRSDGYNRDNCFMYFDFDDRYEYVEAVGSAISRREGVVLSVVVHAAVVLALLFAPQPGDVPGRRPIEPRAGRGSSRRPAAGRGAALRLRRAAARRCRRRRRRRRPTRPTWTGRRSAPELAERPENPLPFSRGNSTERVEAAPDERPTGRGPEPEPAPPAPTAPAEDARRAARAPDGAAGARAAPRLTASRHGAAALGEALRNLQKYVQRESFNNPQGGVQRVRPGHPVRHQGRRVRAVDPPLRRPGEAQLVHAQRGAMRCAATWSCSSTSTRTARSPTSTSCGRRTVDSFNRSAVQRARRVESDAAAAARVPGRQGVLHGDVLLQRVADAQQWRMPRRCAAASSWACWSVLARRWPGSSLRQLAC